MSPFFVVFLVLLLGSTSYAAGRLHGQLSYRIGYRFGYRQGYFDGDRGAWNRRRREAQAAIASALAVPPGFTGRGGGAAVRSGTTYTGSAFTPGVTTAGRPAGLTASGRQAAGALGGGQPTVAVAAGQSTVTVAGRYPTGTLAGRRG